MIVTSGGVSMGEYDLVKQVLGELGNIEFWQVAMQPAKPFAFGKVGGKPLFGLPGNPVSSLVAFEQFVRPGLLKMMGPGASSDRGCRVAPESSSRPIRRRPSSSGSAPRPRARYVGANHPAGSLPTCSRRSRPGTHSPSCPKEPADVEAGEPVMLEMFRWPEERTFDER